MVRTRDVDRPLRRDVRFLGRVLGEVLVEQEGQELFDLEERVRELSIKRRRGPRQERAAAEAELAELLSALPQHQIEPLIRAFAVYFRLVNLAEQHHRIRRARAYATDPAAAPQRGSLAAVLMAARRAGVSAERARENVRALEVTLCFTAHPTEATRRTILEKLYRIARTLEERDRCRLTPSEEEEALRVVREEVTAMWQTDGVRRERPTVGDEVKNVVWYIEEILWDLVPAVPRELERAFERAYGEPLGERVLPLRFHSWVGGDMDGNPLVSPDVLEDAIRAYRARALRRLLADIGQLGGALSQSTRYARLPEALLASIEADAQAMPEIAEQVAPATEGEPWRRKLRFIEARLLAALEVVEARRDRMRRPSSVRPPPPGTQGEGAPASSAASLERSSGIGYTRGAELAADLAVVADTLRDARGSRAGERRVRAVLDRVRMVGLSLAELELRTPAADAVHALRVLEAGAEPTPDSERFFEALRRIARAQEEGGEEGCRTVVLAMTETAEDVLAAFRCARAAGLWDGARECATVDVVPLFEKLGALDASPAVLRELLDHPEYRRHLEARGVQEVMVGYSDSGKEVGLLAASAALRRAQVALPAIANLAGISLRIFHGRGESVARGGGPAQQAILALPRDAVHGRYKATEQGEALDHKYGRPELAMRTVELILGGALLHTLGTQDQPDAVAEARFVSAFDELAEVGRKAYRRLVWDEPLFTEFFSQATPIDEIARLPIGSRPSKRRAGGVEALRAIPWVFAWTQSRAILPGWYGVGSALEAVGATREGEVTLAAMVKGWPFFRAVLDNVEMVLAKTDLDIAARYAELASPEARRAVWTPILAEHKLTRKWVKRLTGHRRLLDGNPPLQRSIGLRNPYVDPLSFLQVELLRARRAGDERADRPLLLTLNGIAGGMRGTG